MTKPSKKFPKWDLKDLTLECVGIHHRVTLSTRRFLKTRIEAQPIIVEFKREPTNPADKNAIAVYAAGGESNPYDGMKLGYLRKHTAAVLAPKLDKGEAEFGTSLMTSMEEIEGIAVVEAKLRVRRNLRIALDTITLSR